MKKSNINITDILANSLTLASKIIIFSERLEKSNKKAIAQKVSETAVNLNRFIFEAKYAVLDFDYIYKMEKACNCANDLLYWLKQCQLSDKYPKDPNLMKDVKDFINQIHKQTNCCVEKQKIELV